MNTNLKTNNFKEIIDETISLIISDYKNLNINLNTDFFIVENINQYSLFWHNIENFCTLQVSKRSRVFDINVLGDGYSALALYEDVLYSYLKIKQEETKKYFKTTVNKAFYKLRHLIGEYFDFYLLDFHNNVYLTNWVNYPFIMHLFRIACRKVLFDLEVFILHEYSNSSTQNIKDNASKLKSANYFNLTDREKEVANLIISNGYKNQKIAEKLSISIDTVESHLKNIFKKLSIKNRSQMASKILNIPEIR